MNEEPQETEGQAVPADPVERRMRRSAAVAERGVPARLRLTPERRKRASEFQQAQAGTRARLSRAEILRAGALSRREAIFKNMAALWLAHDTAEQADDRTQAALVLEEIGRQANAYADTLAELGEFKDAAGWASSPEKAREYREIARAIALDDAARCDCPDTPAQVEGRTVMLSPRFTERMVFSKQHGGEVHAVRCNTCGHLNVRPSTGRLERQRTRQDESTRAARAGGGAEPVHDSVTLLQR